MRTGWLLLLAGCPKPGGRIPTLGWEELFVPARYDYEEVTTTDDGEPARTTVTEEWVAAEGVPAPDGFPGQVWAVDDSPEEGPTLRTWFVSGEGGLAYFGTAGPHGAQRSFSPKVLLPVELEAGTTWQGTSGEGPNRNTRSCSVEATPYCSAGAAVACVTRWTGRVMWMRQHFCRGLGWVAYESVTLSDGHTIRTWSEEATRDGQALPLVGLERRPLPDPAALAGATAATR